MNDTPQGDGNYMYMFALLETVGKIIRMNDTPQGDGNLKM